MPILEMSTCLACGKKNLVSYPAKFSEFIAHRVFAGRNNSFHLLHCQDCGFAFYDYRFSDDEVARLYHNYRDEVYQRQRQQYEKWYSEEYNASLGISPKEISHRKQTIIKSLAPYIQGENLLLLDFGGDRGQMIPALPHVIQNYVYDISAVKPEPGVLSLDSLDACYKQAPFDILLCCHVLEHVADPAVEVKDFASLLKKGGLLYLEVPFDSPFYTSWRSKWSILTNPYYSWKDLWNFWKSRHAKPIFELHEHINFFTLQAARELLKRLGFHEVYSVSRGKPLPHILVAQLSNKV